MKLSKKILAIVTAGAFAAGGAALVAPQAKAATWTDYGYNSVSDGWTGNGISGVLGMAVGWETDGLCNVRPAQVTAGHPDGLRITNSSPYTVTVHGHNEITGNSNEYWVTQGLVYARTIPPAGARWHMHTKSSTFNIAPNTTATVPVDSGWTTFVTSLTPNSTTVPYSQNPIFSLVAFVKNGGVETDQTMKINLELPRPQLNC